MNQDPYLVGWAHSKFGRSDAVGLEELMVEVIAPAIHHAGLAATDIDAAFIGVFNSGFVPQGFEAALVGMAVPDLRHRPATRLENACATGSAALYAALDFIAAGRGRIALVVGAEKMTAVPSVKAGNLMLSACYVAEEMQQKNSFADIFGGIAHSYFQRYGDHSDALAMIAAKNHANAVDNPYAHMRKDIGFEFCNTVSDRNPIVAGPLRRSDCALISDGAAALIIADAETAETLTRSVRFRARSQVNDFLALSRRDSLTFDGARLAWQKSLEIANVTLFDLDMVETHDCFTIAELIEYEAMGLAIPGQGHRIIRDGITQRDGRLPVNPSGGLKARGHPLGATGISMHVMAAMQLCGEAGAMQLPDIELAGVFNMGGAAVANYVSILERVR